MTYEEIVKEIEDIGEWLRDSKNQLNIEERAVKFERAVILTRLAKRHLVEAHQRIQRATQNGIHRTTAGPSRKEGRPAGDRQDR